MKCIVANIMMSQYQSIAIDFYNFKFLLRVDLLTSKELESIMFGMKLAKMKTINSSVYNHPIYSNTVINQKYSRNGTELSKYIYFGRFLAYLKSSLPFEISKPIYYVEKTKNSWIDFSEFSIYLFSNRSFQYHQKTVGRKRLTTRELTELFLRNFFWYNSWFYFSKVRQIWNHWSSCDVH